MVAVVDELALPEVSCDDLVGTWYIVRTNFPMWLGGANSHPTLNYARIEGAGDDVLSDLVRYRRKGADKQIAGVDRQDPARSCHFTWRGNGLLRLLRSDWYVVDLDREAQVAAIFFTKTLFTPAGLDVASTRAQPDAAAVAACLARLQAAPSLRPHLDALVELQHAD